MSWEDISGRLGAGLLAWALLCLGSVAIAVPAAQAAATAETMYQPSTVDVINLTLPPGSKEKLEEDPEGEYVEGEFSLAETGGTPQSIGQFSAPMKVGIRLKGGLGSLRSLSEKAAFKIKFEKKHLFLGLKKMTLNNMVQDPSMIHETLAYEAFRSVGVPGPHTGFAYLYVNGENYGLHLNIETVDQEFLEKRFGPFQAPPQHLYSGEYGTDVTAGGAGNFEVTEGEEENRSDLEALIEAVNGNQPADFSERVESVAELREMTREWAVEKYIGNWDGYAGQQGVFWPNNYYLYSSSTGVFQMLPWGTDQTWEEGERLSFDGKAGLMFDDCLEDPSCAAMYRAALREVQIEIPSLGLDSLAIHTAELLEPWQALEVSPRQPFNAQQIHEGVEGTRSFMAVRPADLAAWLATQREPALALHQASVSANGIATTTATATVTDGNGEPVSGDQVAFASTDPGERIGAVTDHADGTYTAQITASRTAGTATITATDSSASPSVSATAVLTQTPAASHVALALQPGSILADGIATTTATATVTDAEGNPMIADNLAFASTDPGERIGAVTDYADGTYTAQITASRTAGTATITATDSSVSPSISATATLGQFVNSQPPEIILEPTVTITRGPPRHTRGHSPSFHFASNQAGSTFECELGHHGYRPCSSPDTLTKLSMGSHAFQVQATNQAGIVGPAVAYRFVLDSPQHSRGDRHGKASRFP